MKPLTKIENRFYIQQYHYLYNEIQFIYYENLYMDTACILLTFICFLCMQLITRLLPGCDFRK